MKLRSNIEYEYNQLKAQNDELTLRSILYEELEQENTQLRALLGEYDTRSTMNPMLARVIASETGNYFSTFTINKGKKDGDQIPKETFFDRRKISRQFDK